ncbi:hypothetical protein M5K25_006593 [Dendrobium thyrsiflorum]|uniref:Uncharacterized protein n=1 Tax=Dendrobium thyrsiflorum TaxID=117978 RepID=A0ABD0VJ79_DENTH
MEDFPSFSVSCKCIGHIKDGNVVDNTDNRDIPTPSVMMHWLMGVMMALNHETYMLNLIANPTVSLVLIYGGLAGFLEPVGYDASSQSVGLLYDVPIESDVALTNLGVQPLDLDKMVYGPIFLSASCIGNEQLVDVPITLIASNDLKYQLASNLTCEDQSDWLDGISPRHVGMLGMM